MSYDKLDRESWGVRTAVGIGPISRAELIRIGTSEAAIDRAIKNGLAVEVNGILMKPERVNKDELFKSQKQLF